MLFNKQGVVPKCHASWARAPQCMMPSVQHGFQKKYIELIKSKGGMVDNTDTSIINTINTFANDFHIVAKGIILFTLFYTSTNWWYYKRLSDKDKDK